MAKKKRLPKIGDQETETKPSADAGSSVATSKEVAEKFTPTPTEDTEGSTEDPAELRTLLHAARVKRDRDEEKRITEILAMENEEIVVGLPVAKLQEKGYGVAKKSVPRFLNRQRMTHKQGAALAKIQVAMSNQGERLESGGLVDSKERVVSRLLEIVADSMG